jgi:predicted nucleic acid-binding protein
MIAVDTNVMVVACRDPGSAGGAVRQRLAESRSNIRIPVFCIGEFWRVVTHPLAPVQTPPAAATHFLSVTLAGRATLLRPGPRYWSLLKDLLDERQPRSADIFDYQIAALCIERDCADIWTFDRRFRTSTVSSP